MAKSTASTSVRFRSRKHLTCSACGARFSYVVERSNVGTATNRQQAEAQAEQRFQRFLRQNVEVHPCPACGFLQAEMVAKRRAERHDRLTFIGILLLTLTIGLGVAQGIPSNLAYLVTSFKIGNMTPVLLANWMAVIGMVCLLVGHILIARWTPNRDLFANQKLAEEAVNDDLVRLDERPRSLREFAAPVELSYGYGWTFTLMILVVVGVASAECVRIAQGWPLNVDWRPPVIGPADESLVYFPQEIPALKGLWQGQISAAIVNVEGVELERLVATTQQCQWGDEFQMDRDDEESARVWAKVKLPNRPDLEGRTLAVQLDASVVFPRRRGQQTFDEEQESLRFEHRFASPRRVQGGHTCTFGGPGRSAQPCCSRSSACG